MSKFFMFLRAFKGLVGILKAENDELLRTESGDYIQFDEPSDEVPAPQPPFFLG